MNLVKEVVRDAAIGVAVADEMAALDAFLTPGCAAAIWRRQPPQEVQSWLDQLPPESMPVFRVILRPSDVENELEAQLNNLPDCRERDWLRADIVQLAETFAVLMSARYLRMRLSVVTSNACRKFHIDALTARLICTYRGTGTQYGISTDGTEPKRVFTVQTGSPLLLRGTLWPAEQPKSGLLHRSPPIEGTGEARLVLVLDPVDDPEDAI